MKSISVIVPIYNCSQYVSKCIHSLMQQTLTDIEYIFVNDCSTDDSMDIVCSVIEKYPDRKNSVIIISHDINKGVSAARNTGLEYASGEYVHFCDGDDWIETNMYESLYSSAKKQNADIVWCDYMMEHLNGSVPQSTMEYTNSKLGLLESYIRSGWTCLWNIIVLRDLFEKNNCLSYEDCCFCEDYSLAVRLFYYAQRPYKVCEKLYHYNRFNTNSTVTNSIKDINIDKITQSSVIANTRINDFFIEKGCYNDLKKFLSWRLLCAKRGWLFNRRKWKEYRELYPESNEYIMNNPMCSYKDKICQVLIMKQYWFIVCPFIKVIDKIYQICQK